MMLARDPQPHVCPRSRTSVSAKSEPASETDPHQSKCALRVSPTDSLIYLSARKSPTAPSGTFTKKIDRQLKLSIKGPPIKGPKTEATANEADQSPSACARSLMSVNVIAMMAMAVG